MMSKTRMLTLLWLTSAPLVTADERFELTPFWGYTTLDAGTRRDPGGDGLEFNERFEQGFQLGARFGVRLWERITAEAEYRYSPNGKLVVGIEDRFLGNFELEVPIDIGAHAVSGGVVFDVWRSDHFHPFLAAAIGAEVFRTGEADTTLRMSFGGGVRVPWRGGVGVRVDARYVMWPHFFLTDDREHALEIDAGVTIGF